MNNLTTAELEELEAALVSLENQYLSPTFQSVLNLTRKLIAERKPFPPVLEHK